MAGSQKGQFISQRSATFYAIGENKTTSLPPQHRIELTQHLPQLTVGQAISDHANRITDFGRQRLCQLVGAVVELFHGTHHHIAGIFFYLTVTT